MSLNNYKLILLSALSFLLFVLVIKPAVASCGARLPMRHYTTDEGLVNNEVITAFQDSRGYLWFGTYVGLSRFDGKRFKNYDDKDIGSGSAVIKTITEDRRHHIWVGYSGGVARLVQDPDGDRFTSYTNQNGLLGKDVVGLQPDPRGGIWILTEQGINFFDGEQFISKSLEGIDASLAGTSLQCSPSGEVFVVTQERLLQLEQEPAGLEFKPCAQVTFPVKSIRYHHQENALYLISSDKLFRFKDNQCKLVAASPLEDEFLTLAIGKENTLWIISETMLWCRSQDRDRIYTNDMLHNKSLSNLLEDLEGNLWLTSWSGISMLLHTDLANYVDLPIKIVSGILKDPGSNLWVAGDQGIVKLSSSNEVLFYKKSAFVEFVFYDDGKIFSSADSGGLQIHDLQGNLLKTYNPDQIYTCMLKDGRGKYWLGSYSGLFSFDNHNINFEIDTKNGLGSNSVWALLEDKEHRLWVGTENGLSRLTNGQWHHFDINHGLAHPSIWHLHEHKDWGILAATGRGIAQWHNDRFVMLPMLSDMAIDNLATDPSGKLWVGSPQGIFRFAPKGDLELYLNKAKGMPVNSTYFRSILIDKPYLHIGTQKGLCRIELDIDNNRKAAPKLYTDEVHINQQPMGALTRPLDYTEKNITFFFHAVYMYLPEAVTYSYFLDGMDQQWSKPSDLRQAVYTNLSPGDYTFKVRAFADDGKQSAVQSIKFTINKAFWQTNWFISLEILLGLFFFFAVSHLMGRQKVRKQEAYARQLEHTVAERTQTLAEARKTAESASEAKSVFLASMSHEIRTPLNSVMGMTEVLLDSELSDEQRSCAQTAHKSANALLNIIDDILDFSRIEAGAVDLKIEPFDLMSTVEDLSSSLSTKVHAKGIDLIIRYAPDLPKYFEGDAVRIRQVLLNLASNAVKFTDQGYVMIDVRSHDLTTDKAVIHLRVEDTGIGIPEKYLTSIFDRFSQTDAGASRKYGGTGLGLAISSQLVSLMGGNIEVKSTPGSGSTFEFTLTLHRVKPREDAHFNAVDFPGLRIIVVDDNRVSREVLVERLDAWNISSDQAETVDEALEKMHQAASDHHPFDIALVDHRMPEMDGLALARAIKKQSAIKDSVIFLLSAAARPLDQKMLAESGVAASLDKPVSSGQLFSLLQKAKAAQMDVNQTFFPLDASGPEREEHYARFNAKILLVEDIPANQKVALAMLNRFGCEVDIVDNGEDAVKRLQEQAYDLIFMDCHLPGMDGFEVTHLIRKNEMQKKEQTGSRVVKRVPIVAMTASTLESDRKKCLAAGMDEYLAKPISRIKLLELLKKMLIFSKAATTSSVHKILIAVENSKEGHRFEQMITNCCPDTVIKYADSGIEACTLMAGFLPDLIILDDKLAGIDILSLLEYINAHERFGSIQVMVVTDLDEDAPKIEAMRETGCSYIIQRPLDRSILEQVLEEIVSPTGRKITKSSEKACANSTSTAEATNGLDTDPVFNRDQLLHTFQGDIEMIKGYIDIFMKDMPDAIEKLEAAIDSGQQDMVEHQAHKVKNMAAESGGKRLYFLADAIEKAVVEGKRQLCVQQLPKLKAEFNMLANAIHEQGW